MFNRFKSVMIGAVSSMETNGIPGEPPQKLNLGPKFMYGRPHFLNFGEEEVQTSADHKLRHIIHSTVPMQHCAGYAECINAGKSKWNEDQAVCRQGVLTKIGCSSEKGVHKFHMPYTYYGLFDGHAGVGAAVVAAIQLHHILHEKLVDAQDDLFNNLKNDNIMPAKRNDSLITGAFEAAFSEMDQVLSEDRNKYLPAGGCTALVALFIFDKLYVANAGDSRAILCSSLNFTTMSTDFTPENERDRIRKLAQEKPHLLGNEFTATEYIRQPKLTELGKTIMYREAHMTGWAYKTLKPDDLKISIITGQGKRSRVMGTIGVTRGFGDHDLLSVYQKSPIKPFLTPHPEVQIHKLKIVSETDVLVMGTDGLWDVIDGKRAAKIVSKALEVFVEKERYTCAATCLVAQARGTFVNDHHWQQKDGKPSSADDISVFVIPLLPYKYEHEQLMTRYREHIDADNAEMKEIMHY